MGQRTQKGVLFLCTGNYYRSRFAEIVFNSVAGKMGLPWKASSRGLAVGRSGKNIGPMAVSAVEALEILGIRAVEETARFPVQATADDFDKADWIVALKETEHLPLLQEQFSAWVEKVEFWHVDDAPEVLALIEQEVADLTSRLIGGGRRRENVVQAPVENATSPAARNASIKNGAVVRVGRETKGRRGKGVTTVSDIPLDSVGLRELAATFKQKCGTGGTVKDGRIEIQGDQRERLFAELEKLGYKVKRVGG